MAADDAIRRSKEGRRQALLEDYAAASRELESAIDPVGRARLERTLRQLEEQIKGLDQEPEESPDAPAPGASLRPLHQLPAPPADFVGREREIAELLRAIEGGHALICGLRGLGGVGKTALALALAQRLAERYPDAQLLVEMRGTDPQPLSPAQALAQVIHAYHPQARLPEEEGALRALYCSVLQGQRALILLDNALDRAQVEPLLPPAGCLLLVTSRQHFTLPGLRALNLDALPEGDAVSLLRAIAPRLAEGEALELARLCGCLPLALRVAGSALAERENLAVERYLRRLRGARGGLPEVEASLSLSDALLPADLRQRWYALSVFPADFDAPAAAAVWEAGEEAAVDALGDLLRYSLVEYEQDSDRYRLHDLVRAYTRARLEEGEAETARARHAAHYEGVLREAKERYKEGGEGVLAGLALYDQERANIEAGQAWAAAHAAEDEQAARLCSAYPDAGTYVLDLRQHPRERIRWLEAALGAARRRRDRQFEAYHLGNLGGAYADLGEVRRAIEYHEQHLAIMREIGDRRGEGQDLGGLGSAYYSLGEYPRAIEHYEQWLAIAREIGDRRGEGAALGNLGNAYYALVEYRRAIEYYEQALQIAREIGDREGQGHALWNMSLALDKEGQRAEAIARAEESLAIREQIESPYAEGVRQQLAAWRGGKSPASEGGASGGAEEFGPANASRLRPRPQG